jgi:ubiquinone/menaquinone biosynthesis C-methylase UbiE
METSAKSELVELVRKNPELMAQQLRKPSGQIAKKIGYQMNQFNKVLYDFVIDLMDLKDHEKILEIGFGNGKFFDSLFAQANYLNVAGIDFSEEMVNEAKLNNQDSISQGNLELFFASSDNLPFQDNSFDKVFCNMVIYFWDEPANHLKEIRRVLKPSGRFYAGLRTKESTLRFPFAKYGFVFYEVDEWNSILKENGFEPIDERKKMDPLINDGGQNIHLESICYIAEKRVTNNN